MRPTPTAVAQSLSARIQVKPYPFNQIFDVARASRSTKLYPARIIRLSPIRLALTTYPTASTGAAATIVVAGDVPRSRGKNTASSRSTRDAISDTVASYAIPDEQGARKKFWTTGNEPQYTGRYG